MQFRYKEAKHDRYDHYPHFKNLQLDAPDTISLAQQMQLHSLLGIPLIIIYFICVAEYLTRYNPNTELFDVLWYGSTVLCILGVITLVLHKILKYYVDQLAIEMSKIC